MTFLYYIPTGCFELRIIYNFLILDEECLEVDANKSSNSSGILCFNEAIPILQFICCKLDETQRYGSFSI